MELSKKKIDELISAVDKIVSANSQNETNLFNELVAPNDIVKILGISVQDPNESYRLYYGNIQKFLNCFLPKDNQISKLIRELVCILLTHKEKDKKGIRHADSRQARTVEMENLIDVLSQWSETPTDFFRLSQLLLQKNKELKYISEEKTIQDYL